ncbi:MAG: hypothetical protein DWQ47_10760 [Acidobacteria bacterium]|nr:MAG: hypothetical protein DWQ32_13175 [Acidobacteriota bacterium]REJ98065.1 MAG: hypothetical protein DWQ38_15975 [Acidobacteriota bacterium]REK16808.1 MAG: hypothetical protein DWQ43_01020 [Acidobacteriota bacterium]REK42719.1 MAG: hypothetical protein DWQ47_10760 [Acidobacteriota bacterium]
MRTSSLCKYGLSIAAVLLFSPIAFGQEGEESFRLEGIHRFGVEAASGWTVFRDSIEEGSRKVLPSEVFAESSGSSAVFLLRKLDGRETTYRVSAGKRKRNFVVKVFKPDTVSSFTHKSKGNPDVRTFIVVPATLSEKSRLVVVMHGLGRNADGYIASWEDWAKVNDSVVIAPEFRREDWRSSAEYNSGNMIAGGKRVPRSRWSFQVAEDIAERVRKGFGLAAARYDMFGHSAGGQFVHRFSLFMPEANVRLFLAANSGWYTAPDLTIEFPYGLRHPLLEIASEDVIEWTKKSVVILRGTEDTERTPNLRQTPEADAQGQHRYDRAGYMFRKISEVNPETTWKMIEVPGAGHSQKVMAPAAQQVIEDANRQEEGRARPR